MRIVFLDIDGVLNSMAFARRIPGQGLLGIDPFAVIHLNRLLRESGAKIVVSSTWRKLHKLPELRQLLEEAGLEGEIIDVTPSFFYEELQRGDEIQWWLNRHTDIESFVILDDDSDMGPLKDTNFVKTNFEDGLCDHHVEQALKILLDRHGLVAKR